MKTVGGLHYSYAVKGADGQPSPRDVQRIVAPATQRDALAAVLEAIAPQALALPPSVLALVPPRAFGFGGVNTEFFPGRAGPAFDPIGAATVAADLAVSGLLQHERAQRLIDFHSRDRANPDFKEVVDALLAHTWRAAPEADAHHLAIRKAVQSLVVTRLMDLAANAEASTLVRADASEALRSLGAELAAEPRADGRGLGAAHVNQTIDDITRFLTRPDSTFRKGTRCRRRQATRSAPDASDARSRPGRRRPGRVRDHSVGRRSCRNVSVLTSRNIGVRGGSRLGLRNSLSKR